MIKYLIQIMIELVMIIILSFKLFIDGNISLLLVITILLIFLLISCLINKNKYGKSRNQKDVIYIILGCSILLISTMYLVGCKTGFSTSYSFIFKNYLEKKTFIEIIIIVVLTEFIRRQICCNKIDSKINRYLIRGLLVILFVLVDCSISDMGRGFNTFSQFYDYFGLVMVASFSKNLLLNYLVEKYGINSTFVYRLIMDLRIFFLPVTPDLNVFIESSVYLIYPYLLYTIINSICEDKELENARRKKYNILYDIPIYIASIIFLILISREFTYAMIAIGSSSMTGEFSKGDAIIYKRYDKKNSTITGKELVKGDIIVFNMKGRVIVHRIHDVYSLYGEDVYITKGDANDSADNWIVTQSDIIGVVKQKIKYIAWPSVWLTENFK